MEQMWKSNSEMEQRQIEANIHGLAILNTCIGISQFAHIINGWNNRQKLVAGMNTWKGLQWDLKTFCHSSRLTATAETAKYYLIVAISSTFVLGITGVTGLVRGIMTPSHPDRSLEIAFMSLIFCHYNVSEALQDAVINLMFYELSKSMKQVMKLGLVPIVAKHCTFQVRQQILMDIDGGHVSEERIRTWRRIILSIREQADRVSDYVSTPQLCLLLQSLLVGSMAIFTALMNSYGGDPAGIRPMCLGLFVGVVARLFVKACMAERITAEASPDFFLYPWWVLN